MTLTLSTDQPNESDIQRPDDPRDPNGISDSKRLLMIGATAGELTSSENLSVSGPILINDRIEFLEVSTTNLELNTNYLVKTVDINTNTFTISSLSGEIVTPNNTSSQDAKIILWDQTKRERAQTKLAWANYVQDWKIAYVIGDSSGPVEFPDNGEIKYSGE